MSCSTSSTFEVYENLSCSSLNSHMYLCSCGQMVTTTHYFLHCPNYLQSRLHFFSVLPNQLTFSLLLDGLQDVTTEVNNMIIKQYCNQAFPDSYSMLKRLTRQSGLHSTGVHFPPDISFAQRDI